MPLTTDQGVAKMNNKFGTNFVTGFVKQGIACLSFALLAMNTGAAQAYAPSDFAPSNTRAIVKQIPVPASAPLGFQIFCMQNPSECRTSTVSSTDYTFRTMRLLTRINRDVNKAITPRNDPGADKWTLNASIGDCEDYVLTKRAALARSGIALGALRIATATTREGIGHAVLIVRTDRGDLVLDNRTNLIIQMDRTDLTYHAISGANPRKWTRTS